jgi:cyclic beta-1,2-glucan synthetase
VAADVYAIAPHTGRGGWSWYTGSAGWLYRLMIESLLGITRQGTELHIKPCLPKNWPGYTVDYRFGNTLYRIEVIQTDGGERKIMLDGNVLEGVGIPLVDDGRQRAVKVGFCSSAH